MLKEYVHGDTADTIGLLDTLLPLCTFDFILKHITSLLIIFTSFVPIINRH